MSYQVFKGDFGPWEKTDEGWVRTCADLRAVVTAGDGVAYFGDFEFKTTEDAMEFADEQLQDRGYALRYDQK